VDAPGSQLHPQCVAEGLYPVLGRAVGPVERCGQLAGEGTDVHDAPPRLAQQWQEGLGYRELSDEVDLKLPTQFL
jgi:hypothetical protein